MPLEAWFPIGFIFPSEKCSRLPLYEGVDWQIYAVEGTEHILVAKDSLVQQWFSSKLISEGLFESFQFGDETYWSYSSSADYFLSPLSQCPSPDDKTQALAFADALRATRAIDIESSLHDAIYIEKLSRLLPAKTLSPFVDDDVVLGTWLTGGVEVSVNSFRRVSTIMNWLAPESIEEIIKRSDVQLTDTFEQEVSGEPVGQDGIVKEPFELAGRSGLESFLNEHVIDIIVNKSRYKALGISFPSSVILHGPPGCGKTFAIERLVEYLGWPSFEIEASSVASPYIHETSKKVAEVFEKAMANAPSILIIDEMEAFLSDRQAGGTGSHRVEEVAEFLRRIPEANKNDVLVVAMTNHIDMIDSAIQRRGRFDHVVKVDMASEQEVLSLIEHLLEELPVKDDVEPKILAKELQGRPLSDVAFVVREGARLAARSGVSKLNQASLLKALESTPARNVEDQPKRKIGF